MCIAQDRDMPGYEVFEKEAWGFKVGIAFPTDLVCALMRGQQHDRINVERRLSNAAQSTEALASSLGDVKTSDIARLMELFQVRRSSIMRSLSSSPPEFSPPLLELPTIT